MKPMDLDAATAINNDVTRWAFTAQLGGKPGRVPSYSLSQMIEARAIVRESGHCSAVCDDRIIAAICVMANYEPSPANACGELKPILAASGRALFLLGVSDHAAHGGEEKALS